MIYNLGCDTQRHASASPCALPSHSLGGPILDLNSAEKEPPEVDVVEAVRMSVDATPSSLETSMTATCCS
jgi:hypothetical protein